MSMKPRLDDDNKAIAGVISSPKKTDEGNFSIPGTCTGMKSSSNSKLDPKLVSAPKSSGKGE